MSTQRLTRATAAKPALGAALLLLATQAAAFEPSLPPIARLTAETRAEGDELRLPAAPWRAEGMEMVTGSGTVRRRAWRIDGTAYTPAQLTGRLAEQVEAAGFEIVLDCADRDCGGFDFRFALPLLPEPEMHVDLGDYRHLTATGPDGALLGVTVSRGGSQAFVHLAEVTPAAADAPGEAPAAGSERETAAATPDPEAPPAPDRAAPKDIGAALDRDGHVALDDLRFDAGSAALAEGDYASLAALARWLGQHPEARLALVGHSDAAGGLAANVALSRRRAEAVRDRLVTRHGVAAARLTAEGAGFLAPRAANATEEGRALNRRVEAVRTDLE